MKDNHDLPGAKLRIQWAQGGKFRILTMDGQLLEVVDRQTMTPLQLSQKARDAFLARHGAASD
jgi:hypothetical protein